MSRLITHLPGRNTMFSDKLPITILLNLLEQGAAFKCHLPFYGQLSICHFKTREIYTRTTYGNQTENDTCRHYISSSAVFPHPKSRYGTRSYYHGIITVTHSQWHLLCKATCHLQPVSAESLRGHSKQVS